MEDLVDHFVSSGHGANSRVNVYDITLYPSVPAFVRCVRHRLNRENPPYCPAHYTAHLFRWSTIDESLYGVVFSSAILRRTIS